jgi:regulator of sigma E protease
LGILVANYDNIYYPAWQMPFRGAWVGIQEAIAWGIAMVVGLATMIWQWLTVGMAPQVAGPFGIYRLTGTVAEQGYLALIKFTGILSINLAVINLLPIPALDGGHLLFIFLEKIFKQRIKPVVEQWINFAGMALLLTLMLVITLREAMEWANTQPWWPW